MEQTKRRENIKGSLEVGQEEQEDDSLEGVEHSPTQSEEEKGQSDAKDDSEKNHRLKSKMEEDKIRLMEETEKDKEKERACASMLRRQFKRHKTVQHSQCPGLKYQRQLLGAKISLWNDLWMRQCGVGSFRAK
jgi:hypothetical protein